MIAGTAPLDLGLVDMSPTEMMFWMYCPISLPKQWGYTLPPNLDQFDPICRAVWKNLRPRTRFMTDSYVYLTAKTLWVGDGKNMNRPGWHCDGFGTDDLNFIWSTRAPTEFLVAPAGLVLDDDCDLSMRQMHGYGLRPGMYGAEITTYPDKHLLRLDQHVIHRVAENPSPGPRTFVKVSISKDRYDLLGNSINHALPASHWPLVERKIDRNHPQSGAN